MKTLPLMLVLSAMGVMLIPQQSALADEVFSMDDINASLQMEYQSQLVLRPQKHNKVKARSKKVVSKKPIRKTPQARQEFVLPPVSHQPVNKTPAIPDAEALFEASTFGNVSLIARLLQQGININVANNERETALHMAAANGRYSAVIYLINHGANIHARTVKNWMPIHHATRFRKPNIVNYLIKKGASAYAQTSDGLSAIDIARAVNDKQLIRILGAN